MKVVKHLNLTNASESGIMLATSSLMPEMKNSLAINYRKIILYDYVTDNSVFECIYYLHKLVDIDRTTDEKPPIEIVINSYGGGVYEGLALIGLIERLKDDGYEIITTNIGKAMSMGFLISMCGTTRNSYRYATYMYHDISSFMGGKAQEMKEDLQETLRLRELFNSIIDKYSSIPKEEIESWIAHKQDKFITPEEGVQYGFVDKIL